MKHNIFALIWPFLLHIRLHYYNIRCSQLLFQETKEALTSNSKEESDRKVAQIKAQTQKAMELTSKESQHLLQRLSDTFRTLELNSNAHELDQWCNHCQCIHTADVLKQNWLIFGRNLFFCYLCQNFFWKKNVIYNLA